MQTKLKNVITVITGSGISRPSGIPTFRGTNGYWKKYNPMELATPQAFRKNPQLVWEWYFHRLNLISKSNPNPAHEILAKLELKGHNIEIFTQNVDNLHEKAGSSNVYHLHGEIFKRRCTNCGITSKWGLISFTEKEKIPKCTECDSNLRPDVVWFNETLNPDIINQCILRLDKTDLLLIIGTSGLVYPVANFPFLARMKNKQLSIVEFNVENTPLSDIVSQTILGPVEITLPKYINSSIL
ncbi:MAG: SIR2 family NAD-dependent protein deacylase [Candidatus Hodarchaeales archaeon]|jgi:NAD-dependent deacetylase